MCHIGMWRVAGAVLCRASFARTAAVRSGEGKIVDADVANELQCSVPLCVRVRHLSIIACRDGGYVKELEMMRFETSMCICAICCCMCILDSSAI